jgi:hypothetical protein
VDPTLRLRDEGGLRPHDALLADLRALDAARVDLVGAKARDAAAVEALLRARTPSDPAIVLHAREGAWSASMDALKAAGLTALSVHATAEGDTRSLLVAREHLRTVLHLRLDRALEPLEDWVDAARQARAGLVLHGGDLDAADAVARCWRRGRGLGMRARDLDTRWTLPRPTGTVDVDDDLVQLLRSGVRFPGDRAAGAYADAIARVGSEERLTRLLSAVGLPRTDAPRAWGGVDDRDVPPPPPCVGLGRGCVHVLVPPFHDALMVHGTLPALADALRARGAEVRLHSAWAAPFNPHALPPGLPDDDHDARTFAMGQVGAFVRSLDLSDADCVVAPGWLWGDVALRHRSTPADARIVVVDMHMLDGIERWKKRYLGDRRSLGSDWWPSERVHVHACFPGMARLYWYASVPLRQVVWRPYPTAAAVMPPGPPARACGHVFTGGAHLRDGRTLVEALRRTPDGPPVRMAARGRPARQLPSRLQFEGPLPLATFYEAIRTARYVVVPVLHDHDKAAGISVIALARAAGRPVIATATPGTWDHLRPDVDALVVPPDDPGALAAAMAQLDADDALLDRLATGSAEHGRRQDVGTWADEILDGAPLPTLPWVTR